MNNHFGKGLMAGLVALNAWKMRTGPHSKLGYCVGRAVSMGK
ncbi:hypothetical protein ACUTQ5_05400 [Serratia sp. NA_112.1]